VVTLLGAIGLESAHSLASLQPVAAHTQQLVDGSPTPNTPVCPGGGSGSCH
jgi:hypothetical protein